MSRKTIYPVLAILIAIGIYALNYYLDTKEKQKAFTQGASVKEGTNDFFLPSSTTGQVIHHDGFSLSYHEAFEQAEWVAYELKKSHLSSTNFKRPYFEVDKAVPTKAAHWKNYKKSGYTRGHLCPAADRKYSKEAHDETFLTSNISPQTYDFNAGVWNRLEQKVRYWADRNDGVFVVTGGVLKKGLHVIGTEKVAIPDHFYKVILDYNGGDAKLLAFLMKHENSSRPLYEFVVSTDRIEELTGIDFFPQLEDQLEDRLEASSSYKNWNFQ
ncbi:MAG: DNA/RNA non-specific endonuclease [Flavobacteriaceae bacterium]|nr:DNA/RNA non-specific endonuclease [Flavobacteriaceae bacterium]